MTEFVSQVTETGLSETHRTEAGRLAETIHAQVSELERLPGRGIVVTDVIALARLHADLAIADELRLIRLALEEAAK